MRKLGKLPPRKDDRTLRFASYMKHDIPAPPDHLDLVSNVEGSWGMMKNDRIGNCTIAAAGHAIMSWTAQSKGTPDIITDEAIVRAYSDVTGYNPHTGENDNGAVELDVLKYWRNHGIAGHKIGAFASIDLRHPRHVMQAAYIFGGVYIGVDLPLSAQSQNKFWHLSEHPTDKDAPGTWGGHAIWVAPLYDSKYLGAVTWGAIQRIDWAWWAKYCDEAYAIISEDFFGGKRKTPQGFDLGQLERDLRAL